MASFTSINVYPWDEQVIARYLKNVHVHFNGLLTPKAVSDIYIVHVLDDFLILKWPE